MKTINQEEAIAVLDAYKNAIVTVEFYKKDGTFRRMNGRKGVKKHLNPSSTGRKRPDPNFYTILFDLVKREYRMFDIRRVTGIRAGKELYIVR